MLRSRVLVLTALAVLSASDAGAQFRRERFHISLNGGVRTAAEAVSDRFEFERFVEAAPVDVDYDRRPDLLLDGGLEVRFWKHVGAGMAVSLSSRTGSAAVEAQIPHPFFDDRLRQIEGTTHDLRRTETGVHIALSYRVDRDPLRMVISGGPSYFRAVQNVVTGVQYAESYPFDTATFTRAETQRLDGSAIGFHVAVDAIWMLHRKLGLGALVRFARASIDLETPDERTIAIHSGGLHLAGGVRMVF